MVDVADEMMAVEAQVGGRVGDAISGARSEASRLRGAGDALKSGLRGIASRVAGLGVVAMVAGGLVLVAACASPIAVWSAYHAGSAARDAKDREAAARAVAAQAARDKAVAVSETKRLRGLDDADRRQIDRLRAVAARASHRPTAPTCPGTVLDAIHGLSSTRPASE